MHIHVCICLSDMKYIRNEALKVWHWALRCPSPEFLYRAIFTYMAFETSTDTSRRLSFVISYSESCMSQKLFAQYVSDMPHIDLVLQLDCFRCWQGPVVRGPWVPTLISSTLAVERKTCITAVPDSDGTGGTTWVFVVWDYLDIAALALRSRVIYWIDHVYLFSVRPLFLSSRQARAHAALTCRKGNLRASPSKPCLLHMESP